MKRQQLKRWIVVCLVSACLAAGICGCDWLSPEPPATEDQTVVGVTEVGGIPVVELADGRTFPLDRLDDWEEYVDRFAPEEPDAAPMTIEPKDLPEAVDLRAFQTPIKTQWGGTCVQFATTAAIEARYGRVYAGDLDLSERFGQLVQKMSHLTEDLQPQASCRENQLGAWGGGGLTYQMQLFTRYRLPLESHLPYATIVDPDIDWEASRCAAGTNQDAMDDYNLDPVNLPQLALQNARFRAELAAFCPAGSLRDPTWYETVMASGYEVAFSAALCGADPTPMNGVWDPGTEGDCGGHAMLMVGYRHTERVFLVKNSWGYDARFDESGYTLMSYDWVEDGFVTEAGYFTAASADTPYPYQDHMLLGRWNLDHDGWEGTLDLYRFSGLFSSMALHGEDDWRLGTYWGHDGVARRVNGRIDDHRIEFWIDWDTPDLDYGDRQGLHFTGYVFTQDPVTLAGTMSDNRDGQTYAFYGTKDSFLVGTPAAGPIGPSSFLGRWEMNHDGWRGVLEFDDVQFPLMAIMPSPQITGTYTPEGGTAVPVSGQLSDSNPREIWFDVYLVGGTQSFHGYLHSHEAGILAGTTDWHGTPFGFVARRVGSVE
jgi:hypothetical protein